MGHIGGNVRSLILLVAVVLAASSAAANATEPLEFTSIYVVQLGRHSQMRRQAAEHLHGDLASNLSACADDNNKEALELQAQASAIRALSLEGNLAPIAAALAKLDDTQASLDTAFGAVCLAMAHPEQGADAQVRAGEAPKILEKLAQIERTKFLAMPIIAAALVPTGADPKSPATKLAITRTERDSLLKTIEEAFGDSLPKKPLAEIVRDNNGNYDIAAAVALREFVSQRKCADEPSADTDRPR